MKFWGQFKGVILVLILGGFFVLIGMIIGSNFSIPDKIRAESETKQESIDLSEVDKSGLITRNGHSPFVYVAQKVKPAVVNISAESVAEDRFHSFMDDDFFRRFFGLPPGEEEQPRRRIQENLGSGFIISEDGYILTNNHVVKDAEEVTVTLSDEHKYKAEIVGTDAETDLALVKISVDYDLPVIELGDSDSILVGDWVIAVGNPFPHLGLDRTVTVGVVSAKGRKGLVFGGDIPSYQNYIQTDASINPGNSGGPLVDLNGRAVGVNSAIASPSGGNVGIGFAIPINLAQNIANQLKTGGIVSRGYLGILPQDITPDLKEAQDLPSTEGILVAQVDEDTPAEKAGLKVGDVITGFNGRKVEDAQQFRFMVADAGPGSDADLEIIRDGKKKDIQVKLGDRAEILGRTGSRPGPSEETEGWLGLEVETPSRRHVERFNIDVDEGAVIVSVEPGSPADDAGLVPGDVILRIAGRDIENAGDFYDAAGDMKDSSRPISFYIKRGNANIFVAVTPE
ncbi:MAG: DegQ family serine endoprotease [Candidatus Zixiibacteriota bacterium]|nr:MAG: DegQ family serine endoprotease [candidate division Zixibacteria bacterium]